MAQKWVWFEHRRVSILPVSFYHLFCPERTAGILGMAVTVPAFRDEAADVKRALDNITCDELTSDSMVRALRFFQRLREKAGMPLLRVEGLEAVRFYRPVRFLRGTGEQTVTRVISGKSEA